jgi:hypothetical protein
LIWRDTVFEHTHGWETPKFSRLDLAGRCKTLRDSFFFPFHASGLLVAVSLRLDFVLF